MTGCQDTYLSFGMVTKLQTRPSHHGEIPGRGKSFYLIQNIQTDSGDHPVS